PDGRVLVAGGSSDPANGEAGALSSVEVYDPATTAWTMLPAMHDRRRWPTLAVLSDGVYVAGGSNSDTDTPGSGTALASVERMTWADLGISGPIPLDAGVSGGWAADASASCGSSGPADAQDGGASDAGLRDGATDRPERDGFAADASSRDE